MGRPGNYSIEVPSRCQQIIDELIERVEHDSRLAEGWGGPLKTTFLLAMSTPMLVLPLERIFKPLIRNNPGVADDSLMDARVGKDVQAVLGPRRAFGAAPFFEEGTWTYIDAVPQFAVSANWPPKVLDQLGSREAICAARAVDAATILDCIRNGLAHGGVSYLDRNGRHSEDATNMLAFASFPSNRRRNELRLARVSVEGFERFLREWSRWLAGSGVQASLTHEGPGWFEEVQRAVSASRRRS